MHQSHSLFARFSGIYRKAAASLRCASATFLLFRLSVVALLPSVLFYGVSCGPKAGISEAQGEQAPDDSLSLRIACLPTVDCLPFYYAVKSGICDSLRLPLHIKTYRSQFDADTALLGRTVDGGVTDTYRLNYWKKRRRMPSVEAFISLQGEWALMVGGRMRIHKLEGLKGRTVGMARFANSDHYASRLRDSLRLKVDDIFFAQINNYDIRRLMLCNEQIEAAVLPEPYATCAEAEGQKRLSEARDSEMQLTLFLRRRALSHPRHAKQARLLLKAYNLAVTELNRGHTPALDSVLIKICRVPQAQLTKIRLPHYRKLQE